MKEKELDLLLYLFHHQDQFITSIELSEILSLSERTIRTYIRSTQSIAEENGAEIIAKQGYGYRLHLIHPMQFEMFLNKNRLQPIGESNKAALETAQDRQNYILNKLLIEDEHVYLDALADTLFISRSTLSKDINTIKELLEPYALQIVSKPNYGTCVQGKESDKRSFIINYFFKGSRFNSVQEYLDHTSYFDDIPTEHFIIIILDECRRNKIKLSDIMIQNILMHLTLSIKRIEKGLEMKGFRLDEAFSDSVEYQTAYRIIQRLGDELHVQFPDEEVAYLSLHLGAKTNCSTHVESDAHEQTETELYEILKSMEKDTGIHLTEDTLIMNCLLEHLRPMFIRIHQGIALENPLCEEILTQHQDIFQLTKEYLSGLSGLKGYEISDDEWAYLALHFMAAIERLAQRSKLQALVICSTGCGSAQLLKSRIEKEFGEYIHVVNELGYYEMQEQVLQGIDVVISSVNLDSVIFGVPLLHVSVFLSDQDKSCIRKFIDDVHNKKHATNHFMESELSWREKKDVFESYIHKEYFQLFRGQRTVREVIHILLKKLGQQEKESYVKHMEDQIRLRESMGCVVFSDTIAVPHPAIPVGKKASIAVALLPDGLAWNEDFPNIKIVFLLSPSYLCNQEVKKMTKPIIRLIDMPDLQQEILDHPTFEEFKKIFMKLM